ncbi:MAG: hypothetical protein EA352_06610 [Gemmatimonadales bacterium]|nr:MAG: hypothetical protein EA352_06610 [Gemmatimonadales bacterium]
MGFGYFDVAGSDQSVAMDLGWRMLPGLPGPLEAHAGATFDIAGSAYGYAGVVLPMSLGSADGWTLLPSVAAGLWHRGNGKQLGSRLEFRSGLELRRSLPGGSRVGLYLYHLSNASLGERNPGAEVLGVSWTRPS